MRIVQSNVYLLEIVIAACEEESLRGVSAPPQEGGQARQRRVHPQAHQDYEGLHNTTVSPSVFLLHTFQKQVSSESDSTPGL